MFVPRYTQAEARAAVAASRSVAETLRRLGLRPAGGNHQVLKRWLATWEIATDHFDPDGLRRRGLRRDGAPLETHLVEGSSYSRTTLKRRLYAEGYKTRACELCGQGEIWRGRPMALILDHINGVANDNRLENLQIVCPNCAATLPTHCGRNARTVIERACERCGSTFRPGYPAQRFCGRECGQRGIDRRSGVPRPDTRRAERPSHAQLRAEVDAEGWSAVGRRYGVSDNAVRKWMRQYEREEAAAAPAHGGAGVAGPAGVTRQAVEGRPA